MSKIAEQKALEAYPMDEYEFDKVKKSDIERKRFAYIKGYDQAMQDFLEKACEWISKNAQKYMPSSYSILPSYDTYNMIHGLKNYMKNESEN